MHPARLRLLSESFLPAGWSNQLFPRPAVSGGYTLRGADDHYSCHPRGSGSRKYSARAFGARLDHTAHVGWPGLFLLSGPSLLDNPHSLYALDTGMDVPGADEPALRTRW